jgi:hypothetical protein
MTQHKPRPEKSEKMMTPWAPFEGSAAYHGQTSVDALGARS